MFKINHTVLTDFGKFSISLYPSKIGGIKVSVVKINQDRSQEELHEIFDLFLSTETIIKLLAESDV